MAAQGSNQYVKRGKSVEHPRLSVPTELLSLESARELALSDAEAYFEQKWMPVNDFTSQVAVRNFYEDRGHCFINLCVRDEHGGYPWEMTWVNPMDEPDEEGEDQPKMVILGQGRTTFIEDAKAECVQAFILSWKDYGNIQVIAAMTQHWNTSIRELANNHPNLPQNFKVMIKLAE
jgi:hypothetical protein